jgi:hypothetical protein
MAKNGLKKWFAQKWVDIGSKSKEDLLFQEREQLHKVLVVNQLM